MSYTFETELFGLTVEVTGQFDGGENPTYDCEGYPPSFEIDTIEHKGWEMADLPDYLYEAIEREAFTKAHDEMRDSA